MGATAQIPFSNPAGNNQMSPGAGLNLGGIQGSAAPIAGAPGSSSANNIYTPPPSTSPTPIVNTQSAASSSPTGTTSTPVTSASQGFITNNSSYSSGENDLDKQLVDIYGKGVGGSLFTLLNSMSGTDSTDLQEYIQSLQPSMATAQANTNAALGAGGVGANSSVAAIADSNLQSQEFSSIAGESASLTQSQEQLTAQLLSGMTGAAAQEVATSNWSIFGDVMGDITGDVGALFGGKSPQIPSQQIAQSTQAAQANQAYQIPGTGNSNASSIGTGDETLYQLPEDTSVTEGEDVGIDLAAFA